MPRQRCCGLIDDLPICQMFIPHQQTEKTEVVIRLEELESLRLKDINGLEQAECATAMGLSRPTFQRILQSARTKIATALVEGRTIKIQGGSYMIKNRVFECVDCHHVWEVAPCTAGGQHGYEIACPKCGSMKKMKLENGAKHACGGGGHHGHDHQHGHNNGGGCCGSR